MAAYKYKGVSPDGVDIEGIVDAFDEIEAVEKAKSVCSIITGILPVKERLSIWDINITSKVNFKTLSLVCSQFSIVLSAGLPLVKCVEMIADQTTNKIMKKILLNVAQDVRSGTSITKSFEKHGAKSLPSTFIETIRAGEESGTLEGSFKRLSYYMERESKVKGKVKSALAYPLFLLVLAVVVVVICLVAIVPLLTETFASLNMQLPAATQILIKLSDFFKDYWWIVAFVVLFLVLFCKIYGKTERGRVQFATLALKMPVYRDVVRMQSASTFANTMSTLLAAGLNIIKALEITSKVTDNYIVSQSLSAATVDVISGRKMSDTLMRNQYYPKMLGEMVSIGEESGTLESTLSVIGMFYDEEYQGKTQKFIKIVEPAVLLLMAGIVGFILLSIYMPIFSMYQGM